MSPRRKAAFAWAVSAAAALALAGCSPEYHVEFQYWSDQPVDARIEEEEMVLPEGVAVGIIAVVVDDDGDAVDEDEEILVSLKTPNADVLGIRPAALDEPNVFVIYGASAGSATVDVHIDGELSTTIPATVEAQQ